MLIDSYSWITNKKAPLGATKGNKSHDQQQNIMPIYILMTQTQL